ncbi:hypothetical protein KFZ58_18110 [Virgibacillus sp. NKC19-16]|uniref:hypothetical protein n=1 Tax=Virgibacillus salidurans TaxID=2831673 RepID=UPI001F2A0814|nr:hypothetical protein [Virgibacillus sp. NKC19-16]UJL46244.1 hypothetical protein KFZ58_18110 [Virgibacillus sp. NKC19-16]
MLIERINKGIRWFNYILSGGIAGGTLVFINSVISREDFVFNIEWILACMIAGLSYYLALRFLEVKEQRLQEGEEN